MAKVMKMASPKKANVDVESAKSRIVSAGPEIGDNQQRRFDLGALIEQIKDTFVEGILLLDLNKKENCLDKRYWVEQLVDTFNAKGYDARAVHLHPEDDMRYTIVFAPRKLYSKEGGRD